ncbi:MAG TPA: NAD(P)H-dependent oxidoreductase subunit E [Candidatus Brocadiia bacterium]|nr:NAD(P)H-dependent oxidoreductase subunit E [Candidatus Brocadiia bacterium]
MTDNRNTTVEAAEPELCGSVMVVGAGIAGIQAALDLSAAGFHVYVVEEGPSVGGGMARLDKTFPTGDCATCIISPKLVSFARDHNIELMTLSNLSRLEGQAGNFTAEVTQRPRGVDIEKCTGCGECWTQCPVRNVPEATPSFRPGADISAEDRAWLEESLARHSDDPAPLIQMLHETNERCGYLPRPILEALSVRLETPLAEVCRVASFYNAFGMEPVGRHVVEVCLGTACFVRGSGILLERLEKETGAPAGGTDKGGRFTLRTVRCIGCCALAPAMRIDGVTFGKVKLDKVAGILETFE